MPIQKKVVVRKKIEHYEQGALVNWVRSRGWVIFSVPNSAKRNFALANFLKSEGLLKGAPDLIVASAPPKFPDTHVAIEMKKDATQECTLEQTALHEYMRKEGWIVIVAYGFLDGMKKMTELGY